MSFTLTPDNAPLADVAGLNAPIGSTILKHLDQWYYLDDSIGAIA
ncbi:hypothetical protein SAMN05216304_103484 [Bosea sp. OK403]|nr:hypothetical protein [Bosea sp. OK403]SFI78002.1 hypothetical protein SAMN05216304_103484 [Bosea sp. OK403]